jgi:replication factor A1
MAQLVIMKRMTMTGNVMTDDFGPMMIVADVKIEEQDVVAEAEKLFKEVEAAL